jgi:hypothetical protein
MELENGAYRGLPERATVERAELSEPIMTSAFASAGVAFPMSWFETETSPFVTTFALPSRYVFPKSVQLANFTYQGPQCVMRALDGEHGETVAERLVSDGETVWIKAAFIGELQFFSGPATLLNLRFIDFYADRGLPFTAIARIGVAATAGLSMDDAYQRYTGTPTIEPADWDSFRSLIATALVSAPDNDHEALPRWREFETILGARWEYALAAGFAFRDGPDAPPGAPVDDVEAALLLGSMGNVAHVYRVLLDYRDSTVTTNVVVVPALAVPALVPPLSLEHQDSVVRLWGDSSYIVTTKIAWQATDPRAIGLEGEQQVSASPILGGSTHTDSFSFRSRRPVDAAALTVLPRELDVPFYDVTLRVRARTADGWDRVSPWSAWTPWVKPFFDHAPQPPPLLQARHREDMAELIQATGTEGVEDWTPDHAVANTPGSRVEVLRRMAEPAAVAVNVPTPVQIGQFRYTVEINGVPALNRFVAGRLIAGRMRASITRVDNNTVEFEITPDGAFAGELYEEGPGILHQAPNHPDLFEVAGDTPAVGLPPLFAVADPLPDVGETTEVVVYALRVRMGGLAGPIGNPAAALRTPASPSAPPPFFARVLGLDFYERTVVQLVFSGDLDDGEYSVFWADGTFDTSSFEAEAAPGAYDTQRAHNGMFLYETLTLPMSGVAAKSFTLGVQRLLAGGSKSPFVLGTLTVPPQG